MTPGCVCAIPLIPAWELPVYVANFILMDYGTGAIFGCPAHDQRDFDFASKYDLPVVSTYVPAAGEDGFTRPEEGGEAYVPPKTEKVSYVKGFAGEAVQTGEEGVDSRDRLLRGQWRRSGRHQVPPARLGAVPSTLLGLSDPGGAL